MHFKETTNIVEVDKQDCGTFANESATLKDLRLSTMSVIRLAGLFR